MVNLKDVATGVGELLVFISFVVIAYLFLSALCVTVHDVAQCSL